MEDQSGRNALVVRINLCPLYGHLDFNIDGKILVYESLQNSGKPPYESNIIIQDVADSEIDRYLATVTDWCNILALFTNLRLWPFRYHCGNKGRGWSVGGGDGRHPVLIDTDNNRFLKAVSLVWPNYQKYKFDRSLPAIIDYFIEVYYCHSIEEKLLMVSAMLECLKWSWLETKCDKELLIRKDGNYYRKDSQTGKKIEPKYTFESSLTEMFGEVGMTCDLSSIKKLRNNIIHTGLSGARLACRHPDIGGVNLQQVSGLALDLMREYVLGLLEYKGQYWKYSVRAGASEAIAEIT